MCAGSGVCARESDPAPAPDAEGRVADLCGETAFEALGLGLPQAQGTLRTPSYDEVRESHSSVSKLSGIMESSSCIILPHIEVRVNEGSHLDVR